MWYTGENIRCFRVSNTGAEGGGGSGATGTSPGMPKPASGLPNMPRIPDAVDIPRGVPGGAVPWFPPIPKPPGSTGATGGGGAAAGADWGTANSSPKGAPTPPPGGEGSGYDESGSKSVEGSTDWTINIYNAGSLSYSRTFRFSQGVRPVIASISTFTNSYDVRIVNPIIICRSDTGAEIDRPGTSGAYGMPVSALRISIRAQPVNPLDTTVPVTTPQGGAPDDWEPATDFPRIPAPPALPSPSPVKKPTTAPPAPAQQPAPSPATQPEPQPQPQPQPPPATAPPDTWTRTTTWTPQLTPPAPSRGPGTTGPTRRVGAAGIEGPAAMPQPETTPTNRKLVGRATDPVQVDPAQVPETLAGIAAEVGRIESKVASLLARPAPEGFDWQGLLDKIAELLEPDAVQFPAAAYQIQPPCGSGPDGGPPPPVVVPVAATANPTEAVLLRLDALAGLLDAHKRIRQPICKGRTTGEPVTVTFEWVG